MKVRRGYWISVELELQLFDPMGKLGIHLGFLEW